METFVSLPLLEGLYHRPGAAESICREAHRRYQAERRISHWIYQRLTGKKKKSRPKRLRSNKRSKVIVTSKSRTPPLLLPPKNNSSIISLEHWILVKLRSDSLAVRRVAFAILFKGTAHHSKELRDLIFNQNDKHVLAFQDKNDHAIQLVAVLAKLVLESRETLLEFCAGGGLRWISRGILGLVTRLFPTTRELTSGKSQSRAVTKPSGATLETIQTRCTLLINFCYELVLFASVPVDTEKEKRKSKYSTDQETKTQEETIEKRLDALKRSHALLWTSEIPAVLVSENEALSPLACLICACEVLKSTDPCEAKMRGLESCLGMLKRLVDPTATVLVTTSSIGSSSGNARSDRSKRKSKSRKRNRTGSRENNSMVLDNNESGNSNRPRSGAISGARDLLDNGGDADGDVIMEDVDDGGNNQEGDEEEDGIDDEATQHEEEDDDDEDEYKEDEDEEIDSDAECEEVEIDEEEDHEDEDEHDIVIADDEDDDEELTGSFEERLRLLDLNNSSQQVGTAAAAGVEAANTETSVSAENDRKRAYVSAGMQVLSAHHPHHSQGGDLANSQSTTPLLSLSAELSLLKSICDVVKPPRKPLNLKIFLKRAPTQEEFFRGSLSRNPVSLSFLTRLNRGNHGGSSGNEPTVRDLRRHIANDLQMSDSAELLELLVANQILDMNLKLRVVHQVLWKNHLMENSSSSFVSSLLSGQSGHAFISSGSGISMMFSSSGAGGEQGGRGSSSRRSVTADTPASALPPMVVTYRLAGVDGEATEDHVEEASLADPEAPSPSESPEAHERQMEKEYGITRLVTQGRGINVLLRSIESHILAGLRRVRRDDVVLKRTRDGTAVRNPSRDAFLKSAPCSGLALLQHCSKLAYNRKKLLEARAPTVLLRLLLDVLNALEGPIEAAGGSSTGPGADGNTHSLSNPTADVLKELIEVLASDISPSALLSTAADGKALEDFEGDSEQDASTLPMLLSSLRTTFLSPPLRKVIGKLLPFLTYGQVNLSRELALNIAKHVTVDNLSDSNADDNSSSQGSVLMDTFVQATINLPPSEICNSLRMQLITCGFVERIAAFCTKDIPSQPPPWSPALWSKEQAGDLTKHPKKRKSLEEAWRTYFQRCGLRTAFYMLTGLCACHAPTQHLISEYGVSRSRRDKGSVSLLAACHWIESTSDNASRITMNGMGILAETLLDELKEENEDVSDKINDLRKKSRERKKQIAEERRSRALVGMSSFGPLAGAATAVQNREDEDRSASRVGRDVASSILAPVLGFFRDQMTNPAATASDNSASRTAVSSSSEKESKSKRSSKKSEPDKPSWLAEMEAMEDETGLTCAVCQEGRTLQPTELLGLYTFVKKVSIPSGRCGGQGQNDGTMLLVSLPVSLPESLRGTHVDHEYFQPAKAVGTSLKSTPHATSTMSSTVSQSKRMCHYITTVSAGNAIHCTCHAKARSADRNHPKAPKSEWEGASLRNSRVACNAILPLVSSKSSKVHLAAVEIALTDYQTVISNLLGRRPRSMLWGILHDVRLLLLRMSYGEALSTDCGGGSLSSNAMLLFHQMFMADMFANDAEHDSPETAQHARFLSGGFIAVYEILNAEDFNKGSTAASLARSIADAAPMAALCCILFNNGKDDDATVPGKESRWGMHKEKFLCGLLRCAGRRHALGVDDSGCMSSRGGKRAMRMRSSSFTDWDVDEEPSTEAPASNSKRKPTSILGKRGLPEVDDFAVALRPMITYYAIMDQLSEEFAIEMTDEAIEKSTLSIVKTIEACQRTKSIHELLQKAKVTLDHERIIEELQKGICSA